LGRRRGGFASASRCTPRLGAPNRESLFSLPGTGAGKDACATRADPQQERIRQRWVSRILIWPLKPPSSAASRRAGDGALSDRVLRNPSRASGRVSPSRTCGLQIAQSPEFSTSFPTGADPDASGLATSATRPSLPSRKTKADGPEYTDLGLQVKHVCAQPCEGSKPSQGL